MCLPWLSISLKWLTKDEPMQEKPTLVSTTPGGGTVHKYPIPGGKRTFDRFLGCYLGSCKFCDSAEEATSYIRKLEAVA